MAFSDYQYIGHTDEKIVASLILRNLTRIIQARKDRQRWLESIALSSGVQTDVERVSGGGGGLTKGERYVEQLEVDNILRWLMKIELRITAKIKCMSQREKDLLQDLYIVGHDTERDLANKYGISIRSVKNLKLIAIKKIIPACTSVYKEFCLWRTYDDMSLTNRKKENDEDIKRKLRKKKETEL